MPRGATGCVVAVVLDGAEGDSAETVEFEDVLFSGGGGDDIDIGFFSHADLVADGIDGGLFLEGVESEVVEAAVGKAVAIIWFGQDPVMFEDTKKRNETRPTSKRRYRVFASRSIADVRTIA